MVTEYIEHDLDTPTEHDLDLAYGSKYLSATDVGDKKIRAKIVKVRKEEMRGDDGKTRTKFVLFFEGLDKAMVLNATNKDVLADNFGRVPAKWIGATVGILVDNNVMFQGKRTKGLRLRYIAAPKATVTEPPPFDDPTPSAAA
jgi:hypothetical protein